MSDNIVLMIKGFEEKFFKKLSTCPRKETAHTIMKGFIYHKMVDQIRANSNLLFEIFQDWEAVLRSIHTTSTSEIFSNLAI